MKNLKSLMKSPLVNDVLTGLVVAAAFAAAVPTDALAQGAGGLSTAVTSSGTNVGSPMIKLVNYISYGMGAVFGVAGIAGAKKHADSPTNNPLGPALGKLGASAAFLAAPAVVAMLQGTGTGVFGGGTATFNGGSATFN